MFAGLPAIIFTSIPSPDQGVWQLGPIPIRAYALCIIAGVFAAVWIGERRWVARGGQAGQIADIALWAVPFGIIGGRAYHVLTDYGLYFGSHSPKTPVDALKIWEGGLGIWGAIGLGAVGAWIAARSLGIKFLPVADALAPGLLVAHAIGRWGNYFNQELFGKPTDAPWGLEISTRFRPPGYEQYETFHPTFLYESLWTLGAAILIVWADRRFKLGFGRAFALYVMAYTAGRAWIEILRIDQVQFDQLAGLRLNVWTSLVAFVLAAAYFFWQGRRHPHRELSVWRSDPGQPEDDPDRDAGSATDPAATSSLPSDSEEVDSAAPTQGNDGAGQPPNPPAS